MGNTEFNPKKHRIGSSAQRTINVFNPPDLVDNLSAQLTDSDATINTFNKFKLVPYAMFEGHSVNSLVGFFNSLRYMSSTLGSCINSIKKYGFYGSIDIILKKHRIFNLNSDDKIKEITTDNKVKFSNWIDNHFIFDDSILKLSINMFDNYKDNGNIFVELVHTESLGVKQTAVILHRTETIAFVYNNKLKAKTAVICNNWDNFENSKKNVLPIYPKYLKTKNTYRTLIHIKEGNFIWFGRPDWMSAWRNAYNEFQNSDYFIKISNSNFTGKVLLEFEVDDFENNDPFKINTDNTDTEETLSDTDIMEKIEMNFTTQGDNPSTVLVTTRPAGSKPAFVHEFKLHLNEDYFQTTNDINRQKIIENNHWSEYLLGNNDFGTGWNDAAYIEDLFVKNFGVLKPYRVIIEDLWYLILQQAIRFDNVNEFKHFSFKFKPEMEELFKKLDESRKTTTHGIKTTNE